MIKNKEQILNSKSANSLNTDLDLKTYATKNETDLVQQPDLIEKECFIVTRAQKREQEENEKLIKDNEIEIQTNINNKNNNNKIISCNNKNDDNDISNINMNESDSDCNSVMSELRNEFNVQFLTDKNDIETILKDCHEAPLGGHQGIKRTYERLRRQYNWKGMLTDITKYIKKCSLCQKNKISKISKMPMVISDVAKKPFEKIYMDIVGPLPTTYNGNIYILTFEDDLTRLMDCYPMPNLEAATVERIFFDEIISRYRIPKILVTDKGSNFTSELFKRTCKFLKITKIETTAYHPQSNGALERSHRPLAEYLRNFVDNTGENWDQWLRQAVRVRNNTPHTGTKLCPMDCLFGFSSEIPTSLKRTPAPLYNMDDYYLVLKHKIT